MKCSKCGSTTLKKDGDWYRCLECGNVVFDTEIAEKNDSPTMKLQEELDEIEYTNNGNTSSASQETTVQKSKQREVIEFLFPIVIAIIIAIILKFFVFANAIVPTGSMLNTIQLNDRVIASRLEYINNDPERYDIVIFYYPDDETKCYVKRIVGLPGETVQVVEGVVYVTKTDGETIQLDDSFVTNCVPSGNYGPYEVPADSYFMMGDNRNDSLDSRFWENKFVKRDKIIGKVKFRYYPKFSKIE